MSSFLFILTIDWIMKNGTGQKRTAIRSTLLTKLEDLNFADDIVQVSHTRSRLQQKRIRINKLAEAVGLKINIGKTKVMSNETTKELACMEILQPGYTNATIWSRMLENDCKGSQ